MQAKHLPHYTVNDYKRWEGDWELIYGIPWAKNTLPADSTYPSINPSPVMKHQLLGVSLVTQIKNELQKNNSKFKVAFGVDWIINDEIIFRPDIAIISNYLDDFINTLPTLVVEIVSRTSELLDTKIKFEIYQAQGVKYYLLVDPFSKSYNIFFLENGKYQEQNNLSSFQLHEQCSIEIDLQKALAELE